MSALGLSGMPAFAGPFSYDGEGHLIPADKKLSANWVKSLYNRGLPEVFTAEKKQLRYIGMPVGGIGCGQLYIGGEGNLWLWHIFRTKYNRRPNSEMMTDMEQGGHYVHPESAFLREDRPVTQGMAIKVSHEGKETIKSLNSKGFDAISFRGEYPISKVNYRSTDFPVEVHLEAFSPFIPGELDKSSNPATILSYKVKNTSDKKVKVSLAGWLENAVCPYADKSQKGLRVTEISATPDQVTLHSTVEGPEQLAAQEGYGSMAWSLLAPGKRYKKAFGIDPAAGMPAVFEKLESGETRKKIESGFNETQINALGDTVKLKPGEEKEITFLLTWYFPYLNKQPEGRRDLRAMKGIEEAKLYYASRFDSAAEVAKYIAEDFEELAGGTRLWNSTYYDSSLPYWLLDRSFISINAMATATLQRFDNGRIWGWEGVECCPGTCTHVWQYAQGMARIFPEAERNLREATDLVPAIGYLEESGGYAMRAENSRRVAHDGHCGTVMRMYREHKLSKDPSFLERHYDKIKKSVEFIINEDKDRDGLLEGEQTNTLDAEWFGPMGWISSLYLGALAAGKHMALEMGDTAFADECNALLVKGRKNIVKEVFNGEYFIHQHDFENHPEAINSNDGCHIDQVLGQSFSSQLGIPERVVPEKESKSALEAIWKYNFAPDAFAYQKAHKYIKGPRIYAAAGEAGTLMCTWPKGGAEKAVPGMEEREENPNYWSGPGIYFDECMNGFEYQVAVHMVWEGLLEIGLATARAIHDRYHANKRNPYNEIECSDHYSRSMASYGMLLAVCGFDYHGPKGYIAFNPQMTPEDFKAPFTAAEGWGTFSQKRESGRQKNTLILKHGQLELSRWRVVLPSGEKPKDVQLSLNGKIVAVQTHEVSGHQELTFDRSLLREGDTLACSIAY
ncbi:hypothetical protein GCM10028791_37990 [Echinicola sediminis]